MNVRCPKCPQVLQVSQAGNYRCPKCGAMLTVAVPVEMAPAPRPEQARSQARLIAAGVAAAALVVIIVVVVLVRSVSSDTPAQAEIKGPVAGAAVKHAMPVTVVGKQPTKELKGPQMSATAEALRGKTTTQVRSLLGQPIQINPAMPRKTGRDPSTGFRFTQEATFLEWVYGDDTYDLRLDFDDSGRVVNVNYQKR